jgi:hypothetical protein
LGSSRDRRLLRAFGLAAWLSLPGLAAAEDRKEPVPETETLYPGAAVDLIPQALSKVGVRVYGEETITVLADFGPAEASEFRSALAVRAAGPISQSLALRATASGQAAFFDYSGDRDQLELDLGGSELFERLYDFKFALGGAYQLTKHWSLFAEGSANMDWENGASISDAVSGSGAFGVGFQWEPHLELTLGVKVGSQIEEGGVSVSPVLGFRWRIREGMRLETQGTGLMFAMDLLPELELQLRASYDGNRYRLEDAAGAFPEQTLRQREVPVLVALRWKPSKRWRLGAGAGSVVYQKWKVEADDDDGGSSSVDAGPAALVWLRCEYRF